MNKCESGMFTRRSSAPVWFVCILIDSVASSVGGVNVKCACMTSSEHDTARTQSSVDKSSFFRTVVSEIDVSMARRFDTEAS